MAKTLMQIEIDDELMTKAEALFKGMGMTFSEAVTTFAKQCVAMQTLPTYLNNKEFQDSERNDLGLGAGEYDIPDNIDNVNDEIADMFYDGDILYGYEKFIYGYPIDGPYDFALVQDTSSGKYTFYVETIIEFENERVGSQYLLEKSLNGFTEWMNKKGYDVSYRLGFKDVFKEGISCDREYDTVEQAYAAFKLLAEGYINQLDKM